MSSESSSEVGGGRLAPVERDLEQAITALKKGAYLLKYGRRGKPKFCPFRLSNDESVLIWFSGKEEKQLKLSHVTRIIPGQRTAIFQRYPRPEKECQSFSLIYSDRSLDIICKDKDEAEVWFAGLKTLISRSQNRKWRTDSRLDMLYSGTTSPRTYTRRSSPLSSPFSSNDSMQKDSTESYRLRSPFGSPPKVGLDKSFSEVLTIAPPKGFFPSDPTVVSVNSGSIHSMSSSHSDYTNGQARVTAADGYRVSLSSAVSSSSHGSGHDDGDALGDVFLWGEGTGDGFLGGGTSRVGSTSTAKLDSLLPKALEFAVKLDVQNISCGVRHAGLVTKHGEVYSWGEEAGGRLGHGFDCDVSYPKLIDALAHMNIELVACGEYHTCAVTLSGDLYTWGDGTFNFGLLGHGDGANHWVPKRINGPLEGIHVSSISCGPWHTALVTSAGQLFTFGDGTFGVLGHGDCESVSIPKEVESLKGLRTVRASCGVWHTAAVVEVMVGNSNSSNCSSGKIFTWGDGDKGRLGHGDTESRLVPTCVAALVEPNFCQVACGHFLTVALTTSGHVYTMGSSVYGQLGNPKADGINPVRVEGKLLKNFVEEISCGGYHVAVLTSRTEVYTWGKGANGRLGHGDTDDRNAPTLVEALKDKQVRSVVCGVNFTAAICIHKWVSGVDQSMCSGCRQPFNFKRKRHNCYNCALVFCNSCSSKKSVKASLAPNLNKPYRVCDSCYDKLTKCPVSEASSAANRKGSVVQSYTDVIDEDKDGRSTGPLSRLSSMESFKQIDNWPSRKNRKESNSNRVSPVPNGGSHWGGLTISKSLNPMFGTSRKFFSVSVPGSRIVSRATSPVSRRASPPRSTTPTPTLGGLATPRVVDPKLSNENENQEIVNLRAQVGNLTRKSELLEAELERTTKQLKEAIAIAGEESAKCKAAKEVIKSLTGQLKGMAERLPVGAAKNNRLAPLNASGISPDIAAIIADNMSAPATPRESHSNGLIGTSLPNGLGYSNHRTRADHQEDLMNGSKVSNADSVSSMNDSEWVEQDEPGVYITLTTLLSGARELKRVRFSRKRFSEKQAEQWWDKNRDRVYKQYGVRAVEKSSASSVGINDKQYDAHTPEKPSAVSAGINDRHYDIRTPEKPSASSAIISERPFVPPV